MCNFRLWGIEIFHSFCGRCFSLRPPGRLDDRRETADHYRSVEAKVQYLLLRITGIKFLSVNDLPEKHVKFYIFYILSQGRRVKKVPNSKNTVAKMRIPEVACLSLGEVDYRSFNPFPSRICGMHFSTLRSRVLDCLAPEKCSRYPR